MTASLRTAGQNETVFPFKDALFVGSSQDCEVLVRDAAPLHCRVARTSEGGFEAVDLTGLSLIQVNGKRGARLALKDGDTLKVGSVELCFSQDDPSFPESVVVVPENTRTSKRIPLVKPPPARTKQADRPHPLKPVHRIAAGAVALIAVVGISVLLVSVGRTPAPRKDVPARGGRESAAPERITRELRVSSSPPEPESPVLLQRPTTDPETPSPEAPVARPAPVEPRFFPADRAPVTPSPMPAPGPGSWTIERLTSISRGSGFDARYARLLMHLDSTLQNGMGLEATYRKLAEFQTGDGPRGSSEHLRALAASFKRVVHCDECDEGRIPCPQCKGKGRCDVPCMDCNGSGRVRPSGAIGGTDITFKCRNCDGKKIFRDVGCPGCSRSGRARCLSCRGEPWRDRRCSDERCASGRVPCEDCAGIGLLKIDCPDCDGGRFRPSGAIGKTDVSVKCRTCEVDGRHGDGFLRMNCKRCGKTGKVTCGSCGGTFGKSNPRKSQSIPSSEVYSLESCPDCPREPRDTCRSCLGFGARVRPASAPDKVLSP